MPRQINLYSPSLREPQRHFAVPAMLRALAVYGVALVGLCSWAVWRSADLRNDLASTDASYRREQQRLGSALAAVPAPNDTAALSQELAQAQQALAQQRETLAQRREAALNDGARPVAWLQLLSRSTPAAVWVTQVNSAGPRVEIAGYTLQPEALRPWLAHLSTEAPSGARALTAVALQRESGLPVGEAWSFRVVNGAAEGGAAPPPARARP